MIKENNGVEIKVRKHSSEGIERLRKSKLGNLNPMKRPEVRLKSSLSHMGKTSPNKGKRYNVKYKDGEYKCYCCNILLPLTVEFFYTNKHKKNGWSTECRTCRKKQVKIIHARRVIARKNFIESKGNKCELCGVYNSNPSFFDIDHITPIRKTKQKREAFPLEVENLINLQILCPNCHRCKTILENVEAKNIKETIKNAI